MQHAALIQDAVRIPRARVFLDGRTLQASVDPPAASIARFELDVALWQSARSAGVDARQQVTVQSVAGHGPFRIATSDGEFESRALVNASGRWSNLNLPPGENGVPREKWLGVKAHFAEPPSEPSVDLYFFEGGYCGVQPVAVAGESGGRVNASAMVRADVASTLPEVFARHPALRERSRNWSLLSDPVSTSPLIFRQPEPERDGMLMVGDAAGFVDPFVGDGISLALRGGALAAHCLESFFSGEASLLEAARRYGRPTSNRCCRYFAPRPRSAACLCCRARSANRCFFFWSALPRLPTTWYARPAEDVGARSRSCCVIRNE